MRRTWFAALLIPTLLLTACGGGDEHHIEALRDTLAQSAITCEAEVTAVCDGETDDYILRCAESAEGYAVTVLSPERIEGVQATVGENLAVAFDGLVLPLPLDPAQLSPLTALPALLSGLRQAHLDLVWREGDDLVLQLIPRDDLALRVYLSPEDQPLYAELIQDGQTAVRCTVTQWSLQTKEVPYESDDPNLGGDQSQHPGA